MNIKDKTSCKKAIKKSLQEQIKNYFLILN